MGLEASQWLKFDEILNTKEKPWANKSFSILVMASGGNKQTQVIAIQFKDGRKLLVECKPKEAQALLAAGF